MRFDEGKVTFWKVNRAINTMLDMADIILELGISTKILSVNAARAECETLPQYGA